MEMEVGCLRKRLWERKGTVWVTSRQPLMETEGGCLGNRFIQPQQVTQHSMQPL
jgi:hypothetical protein